MPFYKLELFMGKQGPHSSINTSSVFPFQCSLLKSADAINKYSSIYLVLVHDLTSNHGLFRVMLDIPWY